MCVCVCVLLSVRLRVLGELAPRAHTHARTRALGVDGGGKGRGYLTWEREEFSSRRAHSLLSQIRTRRVFGRISDTAGI